MPHLFEPYKIRGITLRNRIGLSPMCQYSYQDGFSNDWQLMHLGARAAGGAGLIIAEATAVEPRGRITPDDVGIWSDDHIEPLAKVTRLVKSLGAVPGIQIAHAGRKANTVRPWDGGHPIPQEDPRWWRVIGPSPLAFSPRHQTPQEMTLQDIKNTQNLFTLAAERTLAAGFEWLELHAAHGYLIHSFYSPLSNQRKDIYGGSFENRIRFLLETVTAMRAVWPERLPFTVRISGTDWDEQGWTIEDSVTLASRLKPLGVDLVDCSSGGNLSNAKIPFGPSYQVHIAEAVRREAGLPTAAVGMITEANQADQILLNGQADLVLLGRELLRNPTWPIQAALRMNQPAPIPPQYLRAY